MWENYIEEEAYYVKKQSLKKATETTTKIIGTVAPSHYGTNNNNFKNKP